MQTLGLLSPWDLPCTCLAHGLTGKTGVVACRLPLYMNMLRKASFLPGPRRKGAPECHAILGHAGMHQVHDRGWICNDTTIHFG